MDGRGHFSFSLYFYWWLIMFGFERSEYFSMLGTFKNTLFNLYVKKPKLIAERETLRYKYISQDKATYTNIRAAMYDDVMSRNDSDLTLLFNFTIRLITENIPMYTLGGASIDGWGRFAGAAGINPYLVEKQNHGEFFRGYKPGSSVAGFLSYLSPIGHFITESFLIDRDSSQSEPWYKSEFSLIGLYGSAEGVIAGSFLGKKSQSRLTGDTISFPPSISYVRALAEEEGRSFNFDKYPLVEEILTKTYPAGNMMTLITSMMESLRRIVDLTIKIIKVQTEIESTEAQLGQYVSEYSAQFESAIHASDILQDLELAAKGDAQAIRRLGIFEEKSESEPLSEVPVDILTQEVVEPVPQVEKKSNLPLLVAAGVGIFLLVNT